MIEQLKIAYRRALSIDQETPRVLEFVRRSVVGVAQPVILDVGCGYGRTLRALQEAGLPAIGIDVNPDIVRRNVQDGLQCCLPEDFRLRKLTADVVVMSHVVEHFAPRELLAFMDEYLGYLRPEGFLVIATPLLSDRFFDDFDHIRPYQPLGFSMVFGPRGAQVQYRGKHQIELIDIWFRRSPLGVVFARGLYFRTWSSRWLQLINLTGALLFRLALGRIGRTTGWAGVFRKI